MALCAAVLFTTGVADGQRLPSALQPVDALVPSAYPFGLPAWVPKPLEPAANPITPAKVELGRYLFYDTRLSSDGSLSCASCHVQARAFTDGRAVSRGVTGSATPRNAMSLANVAYFPVLTWANPLMQHLERQALVPLFGQEPVELGLAGMDEEVIGRLSSQGIYRRLFTAAFPDAHGEISIATVVRALAAFERTLISVRSPYDRYRYEGDVDAVSDSAIRGEALFFSERLECHRAARA
jgi:cytochrome c peroxidase